MCTVRILEGIQFTYMIILQLVTLATWDTEYKFFRIIIHKIRFYISLFYHYIQLLRPFLCPALIRFIVILQHRLKS